MTASKAKASPASGRRAIRPSEPGDGDGRYHHGDLREALLLSAERLVERGGDDAFTLRACAREAGVSHAAPAHHFQDLAGLNAALAQRAFERLTDFMDRYRALSLESGDSRMAAIGIAYIDFALRHPGLYRLMFRCDVNRLSASHPALKSAADACRERLLSAVRDSIAAGSTEDLVEERAALAWSVVHGFASLALEGHFTRDCGDLRQEGRELLVFGTRVLAGMQGVFDR